MNASGWVGYGRETPLSQTMSPHFSLICKSIFGIILLLGFVFLFGYPAFIKYRESGVFIKISTDPKDRSTIHAIPAPAITFCASDKDSPFSKGWKNASLEYLDLINVECDQPESLEEAVSCISNRTYNFNETITFAQQGATYAKLISDSQFWKSDVTAMPVGKCHTLDYPEHLGSRLETNTLWFNLNSELSYDVIIHDPTFYIVTLSPSAIPQIRIKKKPLKEARNFDMVYITVTKHIKLNRPEFPCNDSENYNFKRCVKESVSRKIGCRMEWDADSDRSWPVCTSMDQLRSAGLNKYLELSNISFSSGNMRKYTCCCLK